jgi:hypothetical protein
MSLVEIASTESRSIAKTILTMALRAGDAHGSGFNDDVEILARALDEFVDYVLHKAEGRNHCP